MPSIDEIKEKLPQILQQILGDGVKVVSMDTSSSSDEESSLDGDMPMEDKLKFIRKRIAEHNCGNPDCSFMVRQNSWFALEQLLPEDRRAEARSMYEHMLVYEYESKMLKSFMVSNPGPIAPAIKLEKMREMLHYYALKAGVRRLVLEQKGSNVMAAAYDFNGGILAKTQEPQDDYDSAIFDCLMPIAQREELREQSTAKTGKGNRIH